MQPRTGVDIMKPITTTNRRARRATATWCAVLGTVATFAVAAAPAFSQQSAGDRAQRGRDHQQLTVTGCLTAGAGAQRFVLTPIKKDPLSSEMETRTTDVAPTYTYELIGGRDLKPHVGQIVNVTGRLDRDYEKEAEVVKRERETPAGKRGDTTSRVETKEKAELEIRRLQVQTVDSTGKSCAPES
jgi:hypothetical protein